MLHTKSLVIARDILISTVRGIGRLDYGLI